MNALDGTARALPGSIPGSIPGATGTEAKDELVDRYALEPPDAGGSKELGQNEFLKLMLAQMENQDPFKPMENGEFIGQMAQFSTVTGIEKMQGSLEDLATNFGAQQTLGASELVGREVLSPGDTLVADGASPAGGRFELDGAADAVTLSVYGPNGALVAQRALGAHAVGRHDFEWNGRDDRGDALPAGEYRVVIGATSGDGELGVETLVSHRVDSVEFGAGGKVLLNTADGQRLNLGDVREISEDGVRAATSDANDENEDDDGATTDGSAG